MSRYTTSKRVSGIGCTFRRLYNSDSGHRSLYITKINGAYKVTENHIGVDRLTYIADLQQTKDIINTFEDSYMLEYKATKERATIIYGEACRAHIQSYDIDIYVQRFRVSGDFNNLTINMIVNAINTNKDWIKC